MPYYYKTVYPTINDDVILKADDLFFGISYDFIETSRTISTKGPAADLFVKIKDDERTFFVSLITGNRYDFYDNKYSKAQAEFYAQCRRIKEVNPNNKEKMMSELDIMFALYNNGFFNVYIDDGNQEPSYLPKSNVPYAIIAKPINKNNSDIKVPDEVTKKEVMQLFSQYIERNLQHQTR